jgi:SAM-dependent methyltransferase
VNSDNEQLTRLYQGRFDAAQRAAKQRVWAVLVRDFFQRFVARDATVLDIGCGFGEFLNHVECGQRVGIDMNPESAGMLRADVELHCRPADDLSFLAAERFDVVFISNFLEHLPDKASVERLLHGVRRVLRPGGQCIIMGPNIRFLPGSYWDYWDHSVAITDRSLCEVLELTGFELIECRPRFLPYTIRSAMPSWPWLVWLYLRLPWAWRFFGRQFLARVARPAQ